MAPPTVRYGLRGAVGPDETVQEPVEPLPLLHGPLRGPVAVSLEVRLIEQVGFASHRLGTRDQLSSLGDDRIPDRRGASWRGGLGRWPLPSAPPPCGAGWPPRDSVEAGAWLKALRLRGWVRTGSTPGCPRSGNRRLPPPVPREQGELDAVDAARGSGRFANSEDFAIPSAFVQVTDVAPLIPCPVPLRRWP